MEAPADLARVEALGARFRPVLIVVGMLVVVLVVAGLAVLAVIG